MPTALTVQELDDAEVTPTANNADNSEGNSIPNPNGDVCLRFENKDGANSATATIAAQETSREVPGRGTFTKANVAIALDAGEVGYFYTNGVAYNDSSDNVQVTYTGDGAASVDVEVFRVPRR